MTVMTADKTWQETLPLLEKRVGQATCGAVLKQIVPLGFDGGIFSCSVLNGTALRVAERHLRTVEKCLSEVLGEPVELQLELCETAKPALPTAPLRPNRTTGCNEATRNDGGMPLDPRYTLESFMVADCNRFAHAAAQQVCCSPGRAYNPFFIHSKVGLGKTHLMQAIGHAVLEQHQHMRVVYISAQGFVSQFITAIRDKQTGEFQQSYRRADVWLVDNIQFIAGKLAPEVEFFYVFNELCMGGRQVVIASDVPHVSYKS